MTTFSPKRVGTVETRKSSSFLLPFLHVLDHDAAVLRQTLFADVQLGHDLDAAGDGIFQFQGRRHDVLKNAVDAEADAVFLFVWLDVNVAGASLHGIGQDQVHQLDDRGFVGGPFESGEVHLGFFSRQLHFGFIAGKVFHDLVELFAGLDGAVELADGLRNRGFGGDYRLDVEAGHELDIVHGEDVGRIRHRDGKSGADARKRHDLVAHGGLLRHELNHRGVHLVKSQID